MHLHVFTNNQTALNTRLALLRQEELTLTYITHIYSSQIHLLCARRAWRNGSAGEKKKRREMGTLLAYHTRSNAQPAGHTYAVYSLSVCVRACCRCHLYVPKCELVVVNAFVWRLGGDTVFQYVNTHARTHRHDIQSLYDILDIGQPALDNPTHTHKKTTQIDIKLNAMWPHCRRRRRSLSMCGVGGLYVCEDANTPHTNVYTLMCVCLCV